MLSRLLNLQKLIFFSHSSSPELPFQRRAEQDEASPILKIVHPGGKVDCYFMAIPAIKIMERYPSFVLARPNVFRNPWESVVRPDEILTPGQKFYVVPFGTLRKLRRRTKKRSCSLVSQSCIDVSSRRVSRKNQVFSEESDVGESSEASGWLVAGGRDGKETGSMEKHVRFMGIDVKKKDELESNSVEKKGKGVKSESRWIRRRREWEPNLTIISESQGN